MKTRIETIYGGLSGILTLLKCKRILGKSGVVAIPTETVYGLAGNALDPLAVKRIFEAKGRPQDNPLIVHISDQDDVFSLCDDIPESFFKLSRAFWPGPLTMILKKNSSVPYETTGGLDTVAIRMPSHNVARRIIKACSFPLAAPSANSSGKPSPTTAKHVYDDLLGKIPLIIDGGKCSVGVESTVLDLSGDTPLLLRPGAVTIAQIESVIGKINVSDAIFRELENGEKAASPGMKYKHYSPIADVIIVEGDSDSFCEYVNKNKAESTYALCFDEDTDRLSVPYISIGDESDEASHARLLFNSLREMDKNGAKTVFARCPSKDGVGLAVYNRLVRAAGFKIVSAK
jgi:L-threonylcarbamoyladenylate synthase